MEFSYVRYGGLRMKKGVVDWVWCYGRIGLRDKENEKRPLGTTIAGRLLP